MPDTTTTVDETQVGLVRDELMRATDVGDELSRQQLQESCGIGAGDLDRVLTHLREKGQASEVTPDGWSFVAEREDGEADEAEEAAVPEPGVTLEEAERASAGAVGGRQEIPGRPRRIPTMPDEVRVSLPQAVAKSMDAEGLGKIVEAGISDAAEKDVRFLLVVES